MEYGHINEHGRRAIVLAVEAARALKHNHVDSAHLLLALFKMRGTRGATLLQRLDLHDRFIRNAVIELMGEGLETRAGHLPFTERAKTILKHTEQEAYALGSGTNAGDEHILLSLLSIDDGIPSRIFQELRASRAFNISNPEIAPQPVLTHEVAVKFLDSIPRTGTA